MPRIRQYEEKYAMKDFIDEINAQRARFGYTSQRVTGEAIGVSQATAGKYLKEPESIPLGVLRKMVKVFKPDPIVMLKTLGYTTQDIKQFKERLK